MIKFLKKYRFIIIYILAVLALVIFFIPNEESRYFQPDLKNVRSKSQFILLWTEVLLFAVLFLFALRQIKKITDILLITFGLGLMGWSFFLGFSPFFLSATLFLNKLSKKDTIDRTYNVVYVERNRKKLLLQDIDSKNTVDADQLFNTADINSMNATDTVIVSFKKGLLGFYFDPTIKAIRSTTNDQQISPH